MPFPPYPNLPAPRTWTVGPVFTDYLEDDVANAVSFLANRPSFQGLCTDGYTIGNGGNPVQIPLDTEIYDTWAGHYPTVDQAFWFPTQPAALGYYLAEAYVPYNYSSSTQATFSAGLRWGQDGYGGSLVTSWGEQHPVANTRTPGPCAVELMAMTAYGPIGGNNGVITMFAAQTSSGNVNLRSTLDATGVPRLSLRWVSALTGAAPLPVPVNPSWPVPPDYIDPGNWLNPNIRDTINFLAFPPVARIYYQAGTAKMASGGFPGGTVVPLDTATTDNYSGYVKSGGGGWRPPVNGVYYLYGQTSYGPVPAPGNFCAGLQVAGGTTQWGKAVQVLNTPPAVCVSVLKRLRLTAGQTVNLMGAQSTGSAVPLPNPGPNNGAQSRLIAVWESA